MSDKPTVWILNHYAGSMYEACAGRHHWFAKKLAERGYSTLIFCSNSRYGMQGNFVPMKRGFSKATAADGVKYVFIDTVEYRDNGFDRIRSMTSFYRGVKRAMKATAHKGGRPDIIFASSVHPLTLVAGESVAKQWNIPCICEIRDLWPEQFFYAGVVSQKSLLAKLLIAGERRIYERADALVFLKPGEPSYITEHGWDVASGGTIDMSRVFYINNGVDISSFDERVSMGRVNDSDLCGSRKAFVYAGTVNRTNAVSNLVDAAMELRNRKDVIILVYGSGVDLEDLKRRVKDEQLDNIVFKGFVDRKSIPYILSMATATILNYSASGYNWARGNSSNKLFEYMAAGKPIISNVRMAFDPIVENHCGISLDVSDAEHLANAIIAICDMTEEEYRYMCRSARKAAEQYDFNILTDKLEYTIREVLDDRARRTQ